MLATQHTRLIHWGDKGGQGALTSSGVGTAESGSRRAELAVPAGVHWGLFTCLRTPEHRRNGDGGHSRAFRSPLHRLWTRNLRHVNARMRQLEICVHQCVRGASRAAFVHASGAPLLYTFHSRAALCGRGSTCTTHLATKHCPCLPRPARRCVVHWRVIHGDVCRIECRCRMASLRKGHAGAGDHLAGKGCSMQERGIHKDRVAPRIQVGTRQLRLLVVPG